MTDGSSPDRDAILARRAHFVACALAAVASCSSPPAPAPPDRGAPVGSDHGSSDIAASGVATSAPSATVPGEVTGTSSASAPPEPKPAPTVIVSVCLSIIVPKIEFDADSVAPHAASMTMIDEMVVVMAQNPDVRIEIEGHADRTERQPQKVSEARARVIFDMLVSRGVHPDRMKPTGFGAEHPIAAEGSPSGRARNRRVEFRRVEAP